MGMTNLCLKYPAALAVAVTAIFFAGLYSLAQLPIQLFPNIERPQISIQTAWRAASPMEIESEIAEPLEDVLKGIPGLREITSWSNPGGNWTNMTFNLETDMQMTLLDIISRLNRLPPLPADADPPRLQIGGFGGGTNEVLSWFFLQVLPGNPTPVKDYRSLIEDVIAPRLESIPGVARVNIGQGGGGADELQIIFDPFRAAQFGIDILSMAAAAGRSSDISGGFVDVGRRQYSLRFMGRFSPDQLSELILDWRDGRPVKLGDIAEIKIGQSKLTEVVYQNGNPALSFFVSRENGANVLTTLTAVKAELEKLDKEVLQAQAVAVHQSFDASIFIKRAISLLTNNMLIGIFLAVGVLWWFLRQARATLIIGMAIPISLFATFVILQLTGRSLNVISLAGLAFAVGMVLDAAIVALENIVRLRENGVGPEEASIRGTKEVWGALLASTATTVAIFVPVLFLNNVEGQLFADLALTIAIGVMVSLVVAVTVLPTAARLWLGTLPPADDHGRKWRRMAAWIMALTNTPRKRVSWIGGLLAFPVIATLTLLPSLDYLPPVKRDAVDVFFQFPPGATLDVIDKEIAQVIIERLRPYMEGTKEPALKNYYFMNWQGGGTIGVRAKDQGKVKELQRLMREEILVGLPDTRTFAAQGNLFGGFGGGGNIEIHLQSRDTASLMAAARAGLELLRKALPKANVQSNPSPELAQPELRITPNDNRIQENQWSRRDMGTIIRALGNGLWLGEHFDGEKRMDIILRSREWSSPEELAAIPLVTPAGDIVSVGDLADIERTVALGAIKRVDRRRTFTLSVSPPENMSLQDTLAIIQGEVEPRLRALLPADGTIRYGGSANALKEAVRTMLGNFAAALGMLFLILAALFKSIRDSVIVVITIPLATVGGVIGLRLLNLVTFQTLDLLTMIGFIILLGLVVNNAILLVDRTRRAEEEGMSRGEAVEEALQMRLRPIFMSTLTSIFGMMPLLLFPGAGSIIYRGLATAIVGGMLFSTLFTLVLLPSLMRLGGDSVVLRARLMYFGRALVGKTA